MLGFLTTFLAILPSILRSRAAVELENLALRHQIGVLQRSAARRPKLQSRAIQRRMPCAKVTLVVVMSITARRTDQFPMTSHHKVNEIARRLWWSHVNPKNYGVATLRVFAFDPKLLFCGHASNLGGARACSEHNLAAHSMLYRKDPKLPYQKNPMNLDQSLPLRTIKRIMS